MDKIIDWKFSQLWIKYNPFERPTSLKYSKLVSWHIKASTYSLPTLDILHCNYPSLLNDFVNCFFYDNTLETLHNITKPLFAITCVRNINIDVKILLPQLIIFKVPLTICTAILICFTSHDDTQIIPFYGFILLHQIFSTMFCGLIHLV